MNLGAYTLFFKRKFAPLFITQFLGAFNDNAFKLAILTLISYQLTSDLAQSEFYQALATALFILPFFIFSSLAGQLVDKYDKSFITRVIKLFELILVLIGALGLYHGSIFWMLVTLTGMGIHSAFFGPIKFAILPDHLDPSEILIATGFIEGSTFIAILLGTTLGALSVNVQEGVPYVAISMVLLASIIGLYASFFIPKAQSSAAHLCVDISLVRGTLALLKQVNQFPAIFKSCLAISWFWLVGASLLTKLPDYCHYVLRADTHVFALFLALFSTGYALGSVLVDKLLQGNIFLRLAPIALSLFTLFIFDVYWATPQPIDTVPLSTLVVFFTDFMHWRIAIDFFCLGLFGGVFVVPLYAYLQIASAPESRAQTIAANNIYNALFMVLGALLIMLLLYLQCSIMQVFLIFALLSLLVTFLLMYTLY